MAKNQCLMIGSTRTCKKHAPVTQNVRVKMSNKLYGLFVAHASEDKECFVRPMVERLNILGLRVWYDEFTLRPGMSLRQSIDKGIAESRYGLVIISKAFLLGKRWTNWELDGLVETHLSKPGSSVIPVWLDVQHEEVSAWSPSFAGLVAIKGRGTENLIERIVDTLRQDDVIS